jgi:hypothetical protein
MDVVEDAPGDDRVELLVDVAEVPVAVARPRGCARVDAERVVAGLDERWHDAADVSAPDVEHVRRSRGQVR